MKRIRIVKQAFESIHRVAGSTLLAAIVVSLPACTSMGIGNGTLEPGDAPVSFSWISKDSGTSGTMSAIVGDNPASAGTGSTFSGPFLQVTSSARTESLEPMWNGWRRGWNDWGYWGMYPETAFTTHYSGKVVANLRGPDNQLLRCRFHLNTPAAGMKGGGQGECQFAGGRSVDAVFPRS